MFKRIIVCLSLIFPLFVIHSVSNFALLKPIYDLNINSHILIKTDEFVDLNPFTVKFLFKTNLGAKIEFHIGKAPNKLSLVKSVEKYDFREGLDITNLSPDTHYYYQIHSWVNDHHLISPLLNFQKLPRQQVNIVADWARKSVFYEIFVRSFADGNGDGIGDFKGLTAKIDYLKRLGINAIWIMPHFKSNTYHGYDVVDFYKVEPDYGTMRDFQLFLHTAHENNMKVIIDLVINHTSNQNEWFIQSASEPDNPYRNYYVWADQFDRTDRKPWYNANGSYYLGFFESGMPDLNYRNAAVRAEIYKVAKFWLDPNGDGDTRDGVDGFRLDATLHIDFNQEVNHAVLQEFNAYVKSINPNTFVVGEEWERATVVAPYFQDFESSFNFELNRYIFRMVKGENIDIVNVINRTYREYQRYSDNFIDSTLLSNHDQSRTASILNENINSQKLAAAILLTLPGTPFIYYGEELGQRGLQPHPNVREAMDWYASASGSGMTDAKLYLEHNPKYTRSYDGISVEEEMKDPGSLLNYFAKLIRIRTTNPLFFTGQYTKIATPAKTYGYRIDGNHEDYYLVVIHNNSKYSAGIDIDQNPEVLSGHPITDDQKITIQPYETLILKYKQ
jgi:alpha-amylase